MFHARASSRLAAARLADQYQGLGFTGTVRATRAPDDVGLPPLPATVATTFANTARTEKAPQAGLAATATLTSADGSPPPAGTAVLIESSVPDARWCQEGSTTPTSDSFDVYASAGDEMTVEIYVVVRDASPTTRSPCACRWDDRRALQLEV